jgi:DNA-binding NtrC family response regulator
VPPSAGKTESHRYHTAAKCNDIIAKRRFVQEQSFERVGGENTIHIDARIIAASNRDLPAEVAAHHFREDLFYRLNVIALRVPALREHTEDIMPLAERLLSAAAIRNRRAELRFSSDAQATIVNHRWPGNVRELRNAVERAAVLSDSDLIGPECLPDSLFQPVLAPRLAPRRRILKSWNANR